MIQSKISGIVFLLLIHSAGCLNKDGPNSDDPEPNPNWSESGSATTPPTTPVLPVREQTIEWTSCSGLGFGLQLPQQFNQGSRPHDWEPSDDILDAVGNSNIIYNVFRCERVAWGSFERGPVFTLLELHDNVSEPEDCLPEDNRVRGVLESIWFDDAAVVAYAIERFGMPARFASFTFDDTAIGMVHQLRWTWTPHDGIPSEAQFPTHEASTLSPSEVGWRVYWGNGTGVSYMDFEQNYETPEPVPASAFGELADPMLWARSSPTGSFVSPDQGEQKLAARFSGVLVEFGDTECALPLSSLGRGNTAVLVPGSTWPRQNRPGFRPR